MSKVGATNAVASIPPPELRERFLPEQAPVFELLRTNGDVRLWRSTMPSHVLRDVQRPRRVHYHVTVAEQVDCIFMLDREMADGNFEIAIRERRADRVGLTTTQH